MEYGKLVNGELEYAPKDMVLPDGRVIFDFDQNESLMLEQGYMPVVSEKPDYNPLIEYVVLHGYDPSDGNIKAVYEVCKIDISEQQNQQRDVVLTMFAQTLTDDQAAVVPLVFPEFEHPHHYTVGEKFRYEGVLYKVLQEHNSQEDWDPENAQSLYSRVLSQQPGEPVPEWEQPNSTNPYMKGDKVTLNGVTYESLIDNNVWKPTDYPTGWKVVDEK